MVKCTKRQIRQLKTALHWKMPEAQRQRIQMILLRESGMTQPAIAEAMGVSLSTVNRAHMAYDGGGIKAVKKARRAAAKRGRRLRIMFGDEARFGRMNRPRPCWAPVGIRPEVACQLIREYVYLYGAVTPKDGTCIFLILPAPDTECFQIFLE